MGVKVGAVLGSYVGAEAGLVSAIPMAIIGATSFGIFGTIYGDELGGAIVDKLYGK